MVLDVYGEMLFTRLEWHALRHRPRGEGPVALEPKVVVESSRIVPLHDEDRLLAAGTRRAFPA
jgi:hypothetical protein